MLTCLHARSGSLLAGVDPFRDPVSVRLLLSPVLAASQACSVCPVSLPTMQSCTRRPSTISDAPLLQRSLPLPIRARSQPRRVGMLATPTPQRNTAFTGRSDRSKLATVLPCALCQGPFAHSHTRLLKINARYRAGHSSSCRFHSAAAHPPSTDLAMTCCHVSESVQVLAPRPSAEYRPQLCIS